MLINPSLITQTQNAVEQTHEQYMKEKGLFFLEPTEEFKNPENATHWQNIFSQNLKQQAIPETVS